MLLEEALIEPDTHAKNAARSPAVRLFIISTLLVIFLRVLVLAFAPAAHAIMLLVETCFNASTTVSRR